VSRDEALRWSPPEVRNLAQRSATAAKEIKTLIAESVDKVESGAKLVQQAGTTMDEVVTSFQQVAKAGDGNRRSEPRAERRHRAGDARR
jgi:methyl-accepting chemotaxis protein